MGDATGAVGSCPPRPEDFAPWVNEDDARKLGVSAPDFAAQQAALWRMALASRDQDGECIRRPR